MENTRTYQVPEGIVSAMLNYLSTRPHGEVNKLITAIAQVVQQQFTPEERAAAGLPAAPQAVSQPTLQAVPAKA